VPDGDGPRRVRTRVSTKGQVILPKAVRERHGWSAGTVLEIVDGPKGVTLKAAQTAPVIARTRPADVFGMLKQFYDGPPKTIQDMNAAIEAEVLRRHARGRY
jgi:AbrB family looped-hinge helix DNA binding protein